MKKFAMTTLVGVVGGIACVVLAIVEGGNLSLFINIPSLLIIVGGTAFALIMSFSGKDLRNLGAVMKQAFIQDNHNITADIETIAELSDIARREGLLAIDEYVENCEDPFLKKGLTLLVDGASREDLEATMMSDIYHAQRRHRTGASMVNMIATLAPSLGLVGTYVGLIPMLVHMRDPDQLGPLMAIELVSSFYGGFLAYVIFAPMAKKLKNKTAQEKTRHEMLLEGILAIQDGKNTRRIREELLAYLAYKEAAKVPRSKQNKIEEEYSGGKIVEYQKSRANRRRA